MNQEELTVLKKGSIIWGKKKGGKKGRQEKQQ